MIEQLHTGRTKIDFEGTKMTIQIPSKKNWFIILFLCVWVTGWFIGEKSAITSLINSDNIGIDTFMLVWLTGWTIGGAFAILVLLWTLAGRETLSIDKRIFQIDKGIKNFVFRTRKYDLKAVKNLELNPAQNKTSLFAQNNVGDFWGLTGGKLRFDYGMKTIKFGIGIDEAEARYLIHEITNNGYYKESEETPAHNNS
ncbi:MAG: hypothetical protein HQ522_18875 [Bacteroidetes bacterium]|nr:hypothetical protein [Bacteroidota bacterium]